jgi:hypothetical protein
MINYSSKTWAILGDGLSRLWRGQQCPAVLHRRSRDAAGILEKVLMIAKDNYIF